MKIHNAKQLVDMILDESTVIGVLRTPNMEIDFSQISKETRKIFGEQLQSIFEGKEPRYSDDEIQAFLAKEMGQIQ
jgi:hypothetical protein